MKRLVQRAFDSIAWRIQTTSGIPRRNGECFDVRDAVALKAAFESAEYLEAELMGVPEFENSLALLSAAVAASPGEGLMLEFGVATGRTISHIARERPSSPVWGFDTFEGLPANWRPGYAKGAFAQPRLPDVPPNVTLVPGLFEETLPAFLTANTGPVAFVHVDCDLYASTKVVLDYIAERLAPGAIVVFDEFFNYPGWKRHEYLAFEEFRKSSGRVAKQFVMAGLVPVIHVFGSERKTWMPGT
jgi:predicted O-methyltransferase YrrM